MDQELQQYLLDQLKALMDIDSTTTFCYAIEDYIKGQFESMGYAVKTFNRGGLLVDLGGEGDGIVLSAHADDIGLMVRRILPDGTLQVLAVGGLRPEYVDLANVRVYTRGGAVYTGTVRRVHSCVHTFPREQFQAETNKGFEGSFVIALDIGCVAPGQFSTEHKASICTRDAAWSYDYRMISKLCEVGDRDGVDYAVDIYFPHYGSDVSGVRAAGYDVRGVVVGPGVRTTHGCERTNVKALENTYDLIRGYVQ